MPLFCYNAQQLYFDIAPYRRKWSNMPEDIEYFQEHQAEIDIIADEKALFTLMLIQSLTGSEKMPITFQELNEHLGWDVSTITAICTMLRDANMIWVERLDNTLAHVRLTSN